MTHRDVPEWDRSEETLAQHSKDLDAERGTIQVRSGKDDRPWIV